MDPSQAELPPEEAVQKGRERVEITPEVPRKEPTLSSSYERETDLTANEFEAIEVTCINSHAIAETMESLRKAGFQNKELTVQTQKFLEKNPQLYNSGLSIEKLATDLMSIETKQIRPFISQLNEAAKTDPEISPYISRLVNSVREALYGMVLNGHLDADKITELLNGGIIYKEKPGGEYSVESLNADQAFAACDRDDNGHQVIYVYKNSLYINHKNDLNINQYQSHLIRHEFGHILEFSTIWQNGQYDAFIKAAANLDETTISQIKSENPELGLILELLKDPDLAMVTGNDYIASLCFNLKSLPKEQAEKIGRTRQIIARELVAELIGYFLESGRDETTFLTHRLKNSLMARSGSDKITMPVILDYLDKDPRMQILLESNKIWFEKLRGSLTQNSQAISIHPENQNVAERGVIDGAVLDIDTSGNYGKSAGSTGNGSQSNDDPVLLSLWEKMTGIGSKG